jgi:hypothetical protein
VRFNVSVLFVCANQSNDRNFLSSQLSGAALGFATNTKTGKRSEREAKRKKKNLIGLKSSHNEQESGE